MKKHSKHIVKSGNVRLHLCMFIFVILTGYSNSIFSQDTTPPELTGQINNQTVPEDQHFNLELKLNDIFSDESPLTFSVNLNNADWLANVGDSTLVGFPLEEHVGDHNINVKATDSSGNINSTSFTITVTAVDDKPIVLRNLPGQLQRPGFGEIKINYKGIFYDEEDKSLNYVVESSYPEVVTASIVGDSIVITERGIGSAEIILTATDSDGNETETQMFIRIFEEAEVLNMTTANTGSNGLTDSRITCVRNDSSGNIWTGHYYGISRYKDGYWEQFPLLDGHFWVREIWDDGKGNIFFITLYSIIKYSNQSFSIINVGEGNNTLKAIMCSYITKDNTIYLAGYTDREYTNFIITRNDGDKWETIYKVNNGDALTQGGTFNMCVDNNNNIWIATQHNLLLIEDGTLSNFSVVNNIEGGVDYVDLDISGHIWFANGTSFYKYDPTENTIKDFPGWGGGLRCVFADDIGNIWIGTIDGQVIRIKGDKLQEFELQDPIPNDYTYTTKHPIEHISKTNEGRYWFCSRQGVYISENFLLKNESTILQHTFDGLCSNEIFDIQKDQNGRYWFDTWDGLSEFNGSTWAYHGNLNVNTIDNRGRKLCAFGSDFLIIDEQNNKISYGPEVTGTAYIQAIVSDINQNIWISGREDSIYASEYGLVKFDGSNWIKYNTSDGLLCNYVGNLLADSKGNIWLDYYSTSPFDDELVAISKFDGSAFTHFYESDGIGRTDVHDFLEDLDGNIWMAATDGLFKFDGKIWKKYSTQDGLKCGTISSLALDYAGGIWVTYTTIDHNYGVSRFDGTKFDHFTTADGLPTNNIKNVYVDHALTNQNKSAYTLQDEASDLIWLGSGDKGAANFYLQNATSVIDQSLPEMEAIIFPNPTKGITNIILDNQQRKYLDIEVLTLDGKIVYQYQTSNLLSKVQVNLSSNPPGTYFIRLKSDIDSVVKKIILN